MHPDTESKLQQLLDREAIRELLAAYFNAADRCDNAKMAQLYHDDAIDEHGAFFRGLARDFIEKLPEIQAPMETLHHNMTTLNLKLDGNYAEAEVYVLAFHKIRTDRGAMDLLIGGRYFDKYEKRHGVWKFSHKSVVADWATVQDPSQVNLEHPLLAGSLFGRSSAEDPSYDFFTLHRRGER